MSLAALTLIEHPAALTRLQEQPALLDGTALDEFLRWGPPVYHMRRTATRDTTIGDVEVEGRGQDRDVVPERQPRRAGDPGA